MFSYRLLVAGLFATVLPVLAAETPSCAALKDVHLATLMVSQSELVPAGPDAANPMAPAAPRRNLPEYCVVRGELEGRTGARGAHYGIGFELRLPTKWNHRFLYQGGGGLDGFVAPAVGQISVGNSSAASALERGYAVVSTDSGHHAQNMGDASFGFDQQARLNYAYAAIGTLTTAVLEVVQAYYHQPAAHSYFMGCSNGGREALMAAERFPTLFDGVVAGNPGFRLSRAAVAQAWDLRAFVTAAPSDAHGNKIQARALTAEDMKLVAHAVLDQCDALDGVRDGVIEAMSTCHFKPDALLCKGEKQPTCLTQAQITALHATFDGAHDSHGSPLYATWPYDAGIDEMGWRFWKLGTSETPQSNALNALLGRVALGYYFMTPAQPDLDLAKVDFDRIADQVSETGAVNDAVSTDLSTFRARGGKLVVVHGNSDPVFSADDLRQWWDRLEAANGGAEELSRAARLFIIPGMTHCSGGPALDDIDPLTALERWSDRSEAPEALVARGARFPGRERPICPYPAEAIYIGSGDVNAASSFHCVVPAWLQQGAR